MENQQELEQVQPEQQPVAPPVPPTPPVPPMQQPVRPVYPAYPVQQPVYPVQPAYPVYPVQPVYPQPVVPAPAPVAAEPQEAPKPEAQQPQPSKKKGKLLKQMLSLGIVLALIVSSCLITAFCVTNYWETQNAERNSALLQSVNERMDAVKDEIAQGVPPSTGDSISGTPNTNPLGGLTPSQIYVKNKNSIVTVLCTVGSGYSQGTSQGSGFVLTADGYIATNYHVVEDARDITIKMMDGTEYDATYIGGDQTHDIALVKVEAKASKLSAVTVGKSDSLIVGDQVVAIGYPLNTQVPVLTVGYVSAKDQIVETESSTIRMLQTDAAINSGNSGGPLFNMKGEVIGITSAKQSGSTSSGASIEGVGFAIPMDDVIGKFQDLMEKGYISGAYLGISAQTISQQSATSYGISGGVVVVSVTSGSCAQKADLQRNDVIVNLAGHDIATMSDLSTVLNRLKGGQNVTITVYRPSVKGEVVLNVTLDEKPQT